MLPLVLLSLVISASAGARPACPCRSCLDKTTCCNVPLNPSYGVCATTPGCLDVCPECTCNYVGCKKPGSCWGTLSCPNGACPAGLSEGMMCSGKKVCKDIAPQVPCKVTPWTDWDPCDAASGTKTRYRYISRNPVNNGAQCPELYQSVPCPIDCKVSEWGPWLACGDQSPTNETKVRIRNVTQWPQNDGAPCPLISEVANCPIDCVISDWSPWTQCNNVTGVRTSNRTILREAAYNGTKCLGPYYLEFPCNVDCKVSDWSDWSVCGTEKTQYRSRQVIYQQNLRGAPCPSLNETQPCTQGCGLQLKSFDCRLDNSKNQTVCSFNEIRSTVVNKPGYSVATVALNARVYNYTKNSNETLSVPQIQLGSCGYSVGYVQCTLDANKPVTSCSYKNLDFTVPLSQKYSKVLVEIVAKPLLYKRA